MAFHSFDPSKPVTATRRNLPHWQQSDATYFVTFRLADSLPAAARAHLAELRRLDDNNHFAWLDRYLDVGAGSCLFRDSTRAQLVESAIRHFDSQRYALGAFVIMPNHVHALLQPLPPHALSQIVHSWKSYTARELQRTTSTGGRVWQEESFDRIIRDEAELTHYRDYILANPSAAQLPPGTFILGEGSFTP